MHAQIALAEVARSGLDLAHLRRAASRERARGRRWRRGCSSCRPARRSTALLPVPPSFRSSSAGPPLFVTSRSRSPSLSMSPAASVRPTFSAAKPDPDVRPTSLKRPPPSFRKSSFRCASVAPGREVARVVHDVTVDDAEVEIAVVVVVEERGAEADIGQRRDADAALDRGVSRRGPGRDCEERVRLELVVGHDEIEAAVAVVVAEVGAHARARRAVAATRRRPSAPFPLNRRCLRCGTESSASCRWPRTCPATRHRRSRRRRRRGRCRGGCRLPTSG